MDNLANQWKAAKQSIEISPLGPAELIEIAKDKKKRVLSLHYGNMVIFTITLIGLCRFFYVVPLRESTSKTGMFFMLAGLVVRLLIEIISTYKSKKIHVFDHTLLTTNNALSFYKFRKVVHGPATIITVVLYVIGFYLLSPEFSTHIPLKWMVLMHVFFLVAAVFLFIQGRNGIRKELKILNHLIAVNKDINDE